MQSERAHALDGALRELYPAVADRHLMPEAGRNPDAGSADRRHRQWFATFAVQGVMPMLNQAAAELQHRGVAANARLLRNDENEVIAELVIAPSRLPDSAMPPRLSIGAAAGPRGLALTTSGLCHCNAPTAIFAREIEFETVYTSELKRHIADFVTLATAL